MQRYIDKISAPTEELNIDFIDENKLENIGNELFDIKVRMIDDREFIACEDLRKTDMVNYLSRLGFRPKKITCADFKTINCLALIRYLHKRNISLSFTEKFCTEIIFRIYKNLYGTWF